eukprot:Lankesteria_metandrocarpae@DN2938_c0_g1_i1.p1
MSSRARRRVIKDLLKLQDDERMDIQAQPFNESMMYCHAVIQGPVDTAWEAGYFHLLVHFSEEYPTAPPQVKFLSKVFHPNIYPNGQLCLDILQHNWSPAYDLSAVLTSIQSLLHDLNPESPANIDAAKVYNTNRPLYWKKVGESVEDSWIVPRVPVGGPQAFMDANMTANI